MSGLSKPGISWLLRLKWRLGRMTPRHCWYRLRLPVRRWRWRRENHGVCQIYAKGEATHGAGPVLIIGDLGGVYGLSRGAAYDAEKIAALHAGAVIVDCGDPFAFKPGYRHPDIDPAQVYGTVYLLCQPDAYKSILGLFEPRQIAGAWRIGRWVWETPIFPSAFAPALNVVHEIWTPSEFCGRAFAASGLPVKVFEHQVRVAPPMAGARAPTDVFCGVFRGLAIMDIQSCPERKNPWAHVLAWQAAFGDDPGAELTMKLRVGKRTRRVLGELRDLIGAAQNIKLIDADMSDAEIAALQERADVYLSLHRSEGFGLNILECLLRGKYVLATDFSANADYGRRFDRYIGVAYGLTRYRDWLRHYEDGGFSWADADISDAAAKLRALRENSGEDAVRRMGHPAFGTSP